MRHTLPVAFMWHGSFSLFLMRKSNGHFPEIFAGNNFYCSIVYRRLLPQAIFSYLQNIRNPTWCLWSAGFCSIIFCSLYWLIDIKRCRAGRTSSPAASNPLLTYIIPDIIYYLTALLSISLWPESLSYGIPAYASLCFCVAVMGVVILLNKMHLRLQL